jgi:hypothetical protein
MKFSPRFGQRSTLRDTLRDTLRETNPLPLPRLHDLRPAIPNY